MPDEYRFLQTRIEGATLVCTITNPPQNFLNASIVVELTQLANGVAEDDDVRALVLTGGVPNNLAELILSQTFRRKGAVHASIYDRATPCR